MSWVWSNSRSEPTDRLVLLAIADAANDDGAEAYPSMAKLVAKTGLHERSIQRCLIRLRELGELVVYPGVGPKGSNRYRLPMKDPGTTPPPAERHPGTETPRQTDGAADGHPGAAPSEPPAPRHPNRPSTTQSSSPSVKKTRASKEHHREDVDEVCRRLAEAMVKVGWDEPTISDNWRREARLLLDRDQRPLDAVLRAIDWAFANDFWLRTIKSPTSLRAHYQTMRMQAKDRNGSKGPPGFVERDGLRLKPETAQRLADRARFEAMDQQQLAIEGPAP